MVINVIPYLLNRLMQVFPWRSTLVFGLDLYKLIGCFLFIPGLLLFVQSIFLFIKIGRGTLAPWDPTKRLVVKSLYRYVRNPMILGVLTLLLAEGLFFRSLVILFWALLFFMINNVYFIRKEEPDLHKRFGQEYQEYKNHVPRWLPRLSGWNPENG